MKQSEYFYEEILEKVSNSNNNNDNNNNNNNNNNINNNNNSNNNNNNNNKAINTISHLNISSPSYHPLELRNLISDMKTKRTIIGIVQKTSSTLLYFDKNLKYKSRKDLNIYQKGKIEICQ